MDNAIKKLIDQMRKDTETNIRKIMREAAQMARKDFAQEAKNCIDRYYAEYDPNSYWRTYELRDNSYSPYTLWSLRKVQSGVHFRDEDMNYKHFGNKTKSEKFTAEDVIDSLMFGVHGVDMLGNIDKDPSRVGESVREKMENFERSYENKIDAYFKSQGLKRID